jgi:amidophosphoribosyltransferase
MPSRSELVAHQRTVPEICQKVGADLVIYQTLPDLVDSVRQFNQSITSFDCSVFTGEYITGGVDSGYLDRLELKRADKVKADTDTLGGLEGKGSGEVQVARSQGEPEQLSLSNGHTAGADDTIGLHNTWKM